jgi:quinol monooxygenase YgiN
MLKHLVMWKVKEPKTENIAKLSAALETCRGAVPGMITYEVGADIGVDAGPWDVALFSEFTGRAALDAYQQSAPHLAIKPLIGALREERAAVDYEV